MSIENAIYELSYNDILLLPEDVRLLLLNYFSELTKDIPQSIYSDSKTLGTMLLEVQELEQSYYSFYTFPHEKVKYYPNIIYIKNAKPFLCSVSGDRYTKGHECLLFKPFFYLPIKDEVYVLNKAIRAHSDYASFFPRTIQEYDDFFLKSSKAYELDLEEYYNFMCNIRGNLSLRKLR